MTNDPNLSPTAFWDVDMQTLDYEVNARFVIERVMNELIRPARVNAPAAIPECGG